MFHNQKHDKLSIENSKDMMSMPPLKKKRYLLIFLLMVLVLFLVIIGVYWFIFRKNWSKELYPVIHIEYGEEITPEMLFQNEIDLTNYQIDPPLETIHEVGTYTLKIMVNNSSTQIRVIIEDSISPQVEVQDLTRYIDEELPSKEEFVTQVTEASEYQILDYTVNKTVGTHEIIITVQDIHGNSTQKKATLTILEDKEPPIFAGLTDITIEVGTTPDLYGGVEAVDKRFGNVEFTVDDQMVDYQTPGRYTITYKAKDQLGNESVATRNIQIKEKAITYMINNFPVYNQYPNYPNGCESIALYNLLRYYGVNVTPEEIVNRLKKGDGPYWNGNSLYGGNPEIEFVGDPRDIHGYGVYQKPIRDVANYYKSGMIDYTGHSLNEVLNLVKQSIPVQVWVSINLEDTKVCTHWTYTPTGETINWICNLHSVIIIGFNDNNVYVSDSYTGKIEEYSRTQFEKMYNLFGKRALYYPN